MFHRCCLKKICPYPLSRFKSNLWPAVTLSTSYLFQIAIRKLWEYYPWEKQKVKYKVVRRCWKTNFSSLRIFPISFWSFSVSRCNNEKWCSCNTIFFKNVMQSGLNKTCSCSLTSYETWDIITKKWLETLIKTKFSEMLPSIWDSPLQGKSGENRLQGS